MKKALMLPLLFVTGTVVAQRNCNQVSEAFRTTYNRLERYLPDSATPVKTVQLNFVVFQDASGQGNYKNTQHFRLKLDSILEWVNGFYSRNTPPTDPIEGAEFIRDTKIRFEVGDHMYFIKNQKAFEKDDVGLFQKLADSIPSTKGRLNIFFTEAYYLNNPGIAVSGKAQPPFYGNNGQFLVMYRAYGVNGNVNFATPITLAHELGHALSLMHTYDGSETCNPNDPDYLWDVFGKPPHNKCPHRSGFFLDPTTPGDDLTNNIMGSTNVAFYFSPLQMAKMHRALTLMGVRQYVKDCPMSPNAIYVKGKETWDFSMRSYSDIVIGKKDTLVVSCSLEMPADASIEIKRGGCLVVDGGSISGSCGSWKGVQVARKKNIFGKVKKKQAGVVIMNGGALK